MTYQVKLGGKTFDLPHPFPLEILRQIDPDFQEYLSIPKIEDARERSAKVFELSEKIIVTAIAHVNPCFDAKQLNDLPMTNDDLVTAVKAVALASGLYKEPPKGEGQPVETPAPNPPSP